MTEGNAPDYRLFWGKTLQGGEEVPDEYPWHPAAWHMMDVAAVAGVLLRARREQTRRMAERLGEEEEAFIRLCTFLVGLHDIGKFSAAFQCKAPRFWPERVLGPFRTVADKHHSEAGFWALQAALRDELLQALGLEVFRQPSATIIAAITGHHGEPPGFPDVDGMQFGEPELAAARAFMRDLVRLLAPSCAACIDDERLQKRFSFWLAGLCVVADWLGSNRTFFPFEPPEIDPAAYWCEYACPRAGRAIAGAGLLPAPPARRGDYARFFDIPAPRPLQERVADLHLPPGPTLAIIEDATGSGKTEAAALLAWRMMRMGKAGGLYFALPTMATANAMHERFSGVFRRLFEGGERKPSLALAHGRRTLNPRWYATLQLARLPRRDFAGNGNGQGMAATCAAWIADDRRKTFLADVGVGTIDQALLAVLPTRFQSLRLHALSDRVLVVDEAHAYDAYMSHELETLLRFHAAQGGSAIVLSATLPRKRREALAAAWRQGLEDGGGEQRRWECRARDYPLITVAGSTGLREHGGIAPATHTVRRVAVQRLADERQALEAVRAAVENGAAVAWVRNAVDDAIAAMRLLRERNIPAQLFHARFAMGDRLRIEEDVLKRFGKHAGASERRGRVLVATQVVEQSLDLDFDLMVSDLAPIDLLIQRAGRLWRHMDVRPARRRPVAGPNLLVIMPDPAGVVDDQWLFRHGGKGVFVYRDHALLWRTARVLFDTGAIDAPRDLRRLMESVYGVERLPAPEPLQRFDDEALAGRYADETIAKYNLLALDDGYVRMQGWLDEDRKPTRLGEPTRILRLARIRNGNLAPWCVDAGGEPSWPLSEVGVPARWLEGVQVHPHWRERVEALRQDWPKWESRILPAPVDDEGNVLLMDATGTLVGLRYDGMGLTREN